MSEIIGFLGLGVMGKPMAENLAKRYVVVGYDTLEARLHQTQGISKAKSSHELAQSCGVIFLSLPTAAIVEAVILGVTGIREQLQPGTLLIDLSTGSAESSRRLARELMEIGVDYVDAPVSGGEEGAKAARLAIMVGGALEDFERAKPYLTALAASIVHMGPVGTGNVAKLANNAIVGVQFAAVAEAFALAADNGIEPSQLFEAIRYGWAGSKVLDVCASAISTRNYPPGGTINMIRKDLAYAFDLAKQSKTKLPMTQEADRLFAEAQELGWGGHAQAAVFEVWAKRGVQV